MRPAQGVPSGGNGKFILLAVLLVEQRGILQQGFQHGADIGIPVVVYAEAGPGPGPTKNPDEDIPPPPVIEEAGVDAGKKPNNGTVFTGTQCDVKKCTGLSTSDIETALAFRAKQSHRCYDNALAQDPTLRGKISIAVRIGANGTTCSAGVASNELANAPAVASCVVSNFRGQAFPAPKGGCVDVNIPINFVPRQ